MQSGQMGHRKGEVDVYSTVLQKFANKKAVTTMNSSLSTRICEQNG